MAIDSFMISFSYEPGGEGRGRTENGWGSECVWDVLQGRKTLFFLTDKESKEIIWTPTRLVQRLCFLHC